MSALCGAAAFVLAGAIPAVVRPQQRTAAPASLVFDGVTVVDVELGKLVPGQRVVVTGNRIQAVGGVSGVKLPPGARVVDARGKYLIPGLWDMHVHTETDVLYPQLIANGVTGIRDAWSPVPLDTLQRWRREILAGRRVGPRQILSGVAIDEGDSSCTRPRHGWQGHVCVIAGDTADAQRLIAALKAAGVDMVKMYGLGRQAYFAVAAAARRVGLPFGGHLNRRNCEGLASCAAVASDSGVRILDHMKNDGGGGLDTLCLLGKPPAADSTYHAGTIARCRPVAERLRRNGTWWVLTLARTYDGRWQASRPIDIRFAQLGTLFRLFWADSLSDGQWLRDSLASLARGASPAPHRGAVADSGGLSIVQRAGVPLLTGTDTGLGPRGFEDLIPGLTLHKELAMMAAEGLTPLAALQAATLNPAQMWHATDSLGTVARGKLADLVLLDADPLVDVNNAMAIRAVMANGRYFDRAALDQLLIDVRARAQRGFKYWDPYKSSGDTARFPGVGTSR